MYVDIIYMTTITEGWEGRIDGPNGFMFSVLLVKWQNINSKQTDTLRKYIFESLEPLQVIQKDLEKTLKMTLNLKSKNTLYKSRRPKWGKRGSKQEKKNRNIIK